jgi:Winged helix-turn helix
VALLSKGLGGGPAKLSAAQVRQLEAGPAAWGWDEDQCWTLARIAEVVRRRFKVDYTLAGLDLLLHRIGDRNLGALQQKLPVQSPFEPAARRWAVPGRVGRRRLIARKPGLHDPLTDEDVKACQRVRPVPGPVENCRGARPWSGTWHCWLMSTFVFRLTAPPACPGLTPEPLIAAWLRARSAIG